MSFIIQSPHQKVSLQVRRMVREKFMRFEKLFNRIELYRVILRKEKNDKQERFIVEAQLFVPGNNLFAREQGTNFLTAAEQVCIDLENQIKKHKSKWDRKSARAVDQLNWV